MSFGSDFSGHDDLDARLTVLEGEEDEATALIQALVRRLTTPRGALWYSPNYGYDIRMLLSDTVEPSQAQLIIEAECTKEQRVEKAKCLITVSDDEWEIAIYCESDTGREFDLTLSVDAVSVELLKGG
jgi:hypothetical protein